MSGVRQRIRKHRQTVGKSLQQVAVECDCTKGYLSQVERFDQNGRLNAALLFRIALCLNVSMAALMNEEPEHPSSSEGLAFFNRYRSLPKPDKARFRQVCRLISMSS